MLNPERIKAGGGMASTLHLPRVAGTEKWGGGVGWGTERRARARERERERERGGGGGGLHKLKALISANAAASLCGAGVGAKNHINAPLIPPSANLSAGPYRPPIQLP